MIEYQNLEIKVQKKFNYTNQNLMPKLAEWHIYGNEQQGRFVTRKPDAEPLYYLDNLTADVDSLNFFRILDKKEYELKDHLGNVRVAIGDMKLPENEATSTRGVPPFLTDEKAVNDYYPFGMTIADRSYQSSNYNYSYNKGSEKDNEIYTNQEGRAITTFYREGDLSGVRWWSRDTKASELASQSPYIMMDDNPILKNDPLGDESPMYLGPVKDQWDVSSQKNFKENLPYLKLAVGTVGIGIAAVATVPETAGASLLFGFGLVENLYLATSGAYNVVEQQTGQPTTELPNSTVGMGARIYTAPIPYLKDHPQGVDFIASFGFAIGSALPGYFNAALEIKNISLFINTPENANNTAGILLQGLEAALPKDVRNTEMNKSVLPPADIKKESILEPNKVSKPQESKANKNMNTNANPSSKEVVGKKAVGMEPSYEIEDSGGEGN